MAGAQHPDIENIVLRTLAPLNASADDVFWADAVIIGATENFGYMAGRIKDFFERIYYPCLDKTQGKPFAFYVRAGNDGEGAKASIEKIVTGLRWHTIQEPLIMKGDFQESFLADAKELGMLLAAGLDAGIY